MLMTIYNVYETQFVMCYPRKPSRWQSAFNRVLMGFPLRSGRLYLSGLSISVRGPTLDMRIGRHQTADSDVYIGPALKKIKYLKYISNFHSREIRGPGSKTQLLVNFGAGISMLCFLNLIRFYLYYKVHLY